MNLGSIKDSQCLLESVVRSQRQLNASELTAPRLLQLSETVQSGKRSQSWSALTRRRTAREHFLGGDSTARTMTTEKLMFVDDGFDWWQFPGLVLLDRMVWVQRKNDK